jgi:DNA-binding beta-propeller fold protein YncE
MKILMKIPYRTLILGLTLSSMVIAASADQPSLLTPAASIEIAKSAGKFDFLRIDAKRRRLLAAHENDGTADYFDLRNNTLITRLKVGGAVDTAIDADSQHYYVSVQESERVVVVDAATLKEQTSIKTPGPTDAILYEPLNHMIYVTHDNGADVWVIDPSKSMVVATISIPGVPEYMLYDETADRIYVNIKNKDVVAVIDPANNKVVGQWSTKPASLPHGLALNTDAHQLYSSGGNGKLVAIDTKTGAVSGSVNIAEKVDQIAFDAAGAILYCAGADKMSVIRTTGGKLAPLGDVPTAATAKNVAVDPATRNVWITYTDGKSSFARSWSPPKP